MTEAEWPGGEEPGRLIKFLSNRFSGRKARFLAVAHVKLVSYAITHTTIHKAVEAGWKFAEGETSQRQLGQAWRTADRTILRCAEDRGELWQLQALALRDVALADPWESLSQTMLRVRDACSPAHIRPIEHIKPILLELFGNPFQPVALDPNWLTSDVVAMARGMYETRDFAAMPILADALQDAGCEHSGILDHCRDPNGTHVRGCWVVDLLLGKA